MNWKCFIGAHRWNGNKCAICGNVHDHVFVDGKCKICQAIRSEEDAKLRVVTDAASFSSREKMLRHAMAGGKTNVKYFGSDRRKFDAFHKFWLKYISHVKHENVFHVVCGFRHVSKEDYILIEAFDEAADDLLNRNGNAGVLREIEQQVLSAEEVALKRTGCSSVGNYALPGCRLTSTEEWSRYISLVRENQYVLADS